MKTRIKPADVIAARDASNDAHAAEVAALDAFNAAKRDVNKSRFELPDWRDKLHAADAAYRDACAAWNVADAEYIALRNAHKVQVENAVKRALAARASEYAGMPSRYKKTKALVASIVADGCGLPVESVYVYENASTGGMTVRVYTDDATHTAEVGIYGEWCTGNVGDVEHVRGWLRPMQGADGLTVKRVKEMARRRMGELKKLADGAERYRQSVRKVIDRYRAIDPTDDLRNAATVRF